MAAIDSSLYQEIEISTETTDGSGKTIDLKLGVAKLNIYEDLFSPTITAQVLVVVAGGAQDNEGNRLGTVYNGLPIRGGERVKIIISPNYDGNESLNFDTPETYLYVSNVSRQYSDEAKEIFTLDLVSREAITNETSRVVKRYKKETLISDHVQNIVKNQLASSIPDENIDPTMNKYGFIGNLKKPFQVLVWLASKSQPAIENSLPGYFFYQTRKGFNFRSIDSLIKLGKIKAKQDARFQYFEVNFTPSSKISNSGNQHILQYNILQNNDLITKLTLGQFASHIMEFDPWTGQFTTEQQGKFTLNEYTKETINMGESPEYTKEVPKLLTDETNQNLGSLPSRMITMVADRGLLDDDPTLAKNSEPVRWQREAYFRYQLLFTQILNMVVPLNTRLVAGDLIKVNFLTADIEAKERDRQQSGYYMIKSLCHHFDPNQSLTSMTLIRDTFGEVD